MFDERAALKMRLEQMNDAEERLLAELRKERSYIYSRLRDSENEKSVDIDQMKTDENHVVKVKKSRPSRRSQSTKMREITIDILKAQDSPIRGVDLQRIIEEKTGFRIANMTTFMNSIQRTDDNIVKLRRGLYTYQNELTSYN